MSRSCVEFFFLTVRLIFTSEQVRGAIRAFVTQNSEHTWSGRAVARIFHGIASPNFPAKQWGRVRSAWRSHLDVDFNLLVRMATQEVLSLRRGR